MSCLMMSVLLSLLTHYYPQHQEVHAKNRNWDCEYSCFKRSSTVKQLRACSTEKLLVFNNTPVLLGAPGKRPGEATPHSLGNCILLDPPLSLGISLALRSGGKEIFWTYPIKIEKRKTKKDKLKKFRATCGKRYELLKLHFEKQLKTVINEYFNGLLHLHFSNFILKNEKRHSYVYVCYPYVTRMHPCVTCMYPYVTRMSLVCIRMYPYVSRMLNTRVVF